MASCYTLVALIHENISIKVETRKERQDAAIIVIETAPVLGISIRLIKKTPAKYHFGIDGWELDCYIVV